MSYSLRVRTEFLPGWVSIFWLLLTSAVSSSYVIQGSNDSFSRRSTRVVALQTSPQVLAQCGKNVTLTCTASSSSDFSVKKMSWVFTTSTLCQLEDNKLEPGVICTSEAEANRLTMTLTDMMPAKQGEYFCKLQSDIGTETSKSVVMLRECLGDSDFSSNASHAECHFHGVYPNGTVHWFQGGADLTDSATTQREKDQNGLYSLKSTIKIQPGNTTQPYNCSLWIPSMEKYLSSKNVYMKPLRTVGSSGSMIKLQWICIIVGTLMIKSFL